MRVGKRAQIRAGAPIKLSCENRRRGAGAAAAAGAVSRVPAFRSPPPRLAAAAPGRPKRGERPMPPVFVRAGPGLRSGAGDRAGGAAGRWSAGRRQVMSKIGRRSAAPRRRLAAAGRCIPGGCGGPRCSPGTPLFPLPPLPFCVRPRGSPPGTPFPRVTHRNGAAGGSGGRGGGGCSAARALASRRTRGWGGRCGAGPTRPGPARPPARGSRRRPPQAGCAGRRPGQGRRDRSGAGPAPGQGREAVAAVGRRRGGDAAGGG